MLMITAEQAASLAPEARRAIAALFASIFPEYLKMRDGEDAEPIMAANVPVSGEPVDVPLEQIPTLLTKVDPKTAAFLRCLAENNGTADLNMLQQAIRNTYVGGIRSGLTRRIRAMVREGDVAGDANAILFAEKNNIFRLSPVTAAALREHFGL